MALVSPATPTGLVFKQVSPPRPHQSAAGRTTRPSLLPQEPELLSGLQPDEKHVFRNFSHILPSSSYNCIGKFYFNKQMFCNIEVILGLWYCAALEICKGMCILVSIWIITPGCSHTSKRAGQSQFNLQTFTQKYFSTLLLSCFPLSLLPVCCCLTKVGRKQNMENVHWSMWSQSGVAILWHSVESLNQTKTITTWLKKESVSVL